MARRFSVPTTASTFAHFALEPLLFPFGVVLGQFCDLVVDPRLLVLVEFDTGDAALVIDRDRRSVLDAPVDVVDIDVLAEHGRRVHVVLLDRRSCEADEGSIGKGVSKVFGKPVRDLSGLSLHPGPEAVLAPMCLVRDHDDVPAVGQDRVLGLPTFGGELLDSCEHHAARGSGQDPLQILPVVGLLRGLTEEIPAHGEGAEKLVVEVVAVGDDDHSGVLHRRVDDDLSRVEGHQETLAGALGVPDDADAAVAVRARGGNSTLDRVTHGVELVIPGHDLDDARTRVLEHGEVADQGQEPGLLEHPLDDRSQLGRSLRGDGGAVHGAPRHEPFEIGGQGTEAGVEAIRGREGGVGCGTGTVSRPCRSGAD